MHKENENNLRKTAKANKKYKKIANKLLVDFLNETGFKGCVHQSS